MLSAADLAYMRDTAEASLWDSCLRLVYGATDGDYGPGTGPPGYASGASMACRFAPRLQHDVYVPTAVPMVDADIWLDRSETLDPNDRLTITHMHGEPVANPQTFAIVSGPLISKTLQHAELSLITDGS
jgi:hypothetical protein